MYRSYITGHLFLPFLTRRQGYDVGRNFPQILPVIKRTSRGEVSACLNRSSLWRYVKVVSLIINIRLHKFLPSEAIFIRGQLCAALSRVQTPRGLKIMICGGKKSVCSGVLVKNIVYRELFLTHLEKPLYSCSDMISSSHDARILSFHCVPVFFPVKKGSIGDHYEKESKVSKIFAFSHSDVIALEDPRKCVLLTNDISFGSTDNLFCDVIRSPRDMTDNSGITSVNNFTLAMRLNLVHSIGPGTQEIVPNREDLFIRGTYLR